MELDTARVISEYSILLQLLTTLGFVIIMTASSKTLHLPHCFLPVSSYDEGISIKQKNTVEICGILLTKHEMVNTEQKLQIYLCLVSTAKLKKVFFPAFARF